MTEDFSSDQMQKAETLRQEIHTFLAANLGHKSELDSNYVEIGDRLATMRRERLWRAWGFKNFSKFMQSMESRTQNYHCLGVARDLLPLVSKGDLVRMGISKAALLRVVVKGGKTPSPELIAMALDRTKEELEGAVAAEMGLVKDEETGAWFSYGGAKLSDAEREEFLLTVNTVIRVAELGGEGILNWQSVPSSRKKAIIQLLCAEFLSTYAAEGSPS